MQAQKQGPGTGGVNLTGHLPTTPSFWLLLVTSEDIGDKVRDATTSLPQDPESC